MTQAMLRPLPERAPAPALDGMPARALDSIETCVAVDAETRRFVEERVPGKVPAAAGGAGR